MSQRTQVDLKAFTPLDGVVLRLVEQQGAQAVKRQPLLVLWRHENWST